jgi:branched-chain amino acid transport system substrate-binding protein
MKNTSLLVLCLVIWAGPAFTAAQTSQGPVKIGVPLPLTGQFREFGEMMKNSCDMALDSVKGSGGINGRPMELIFADDQGEVSSVKGAFDRLVGSGAVMLVGGYASDPTYRMAGMAQERNIPFIICTASADKITQKGWGNIYRMNPPISEYTKGLEDFWIKDLKPRTMAIVYENSMFGTTGALSLEEFCRGQAIEIRTSFNYDRRKADPLYFRSLVASLKYDPPDVISMISYLEDAVELVRQLRELKVKSVLCGIAGGFTLPEFVRRAGEAANNLVTVSLWSEHVAYPGAKEYYSDYKKRFGEVPDYHGAEAYAAVALAADVLRRANSFSPEDIRVALNNTYMKTAFGPVKFYSYEGFERQNTINTLVLQIIDGKFETIWPPDMASARFQGTGFEK